MLEASKGKPFSRLEASKGKPFSRRKKAGFNRWRACKELYELDICDFGRNLEKLRKFYPVKTICMHGSPLSKWDNLDLWKKYNYREFGINISQEKDGFLRRSYREHIDY
ncbi:MAG: hypothetical protein JRI62_03015 [Deltaproteobacteria bacterium]|nr:hypothetical protein [Deltaproteobacteria bacterium]